jgi:hypothetical protein
VYVDKESHGQKSPSLKYERLLPAAVPNLPCDSVAVSTGVLMIQANQKSSDPTVVFFKTFRYCARLPDQLDD